MKFIDEIFLSTRIDADQVILLGLFIFRQAEFACISNLDHINLCNTHLAHPSGQQRDIVFMDLGCDSTSLLLEFIQPLIGVFLVVQSSQHKVLNRLIFFYYVTIDVDSNVDMDFWDSGVFSHHNTLHILVTIWQVAIFRQLLSELGINSLLLEGLGQLSGLHAKSIGDFFIVWKKLKGVFVDGLEFEVRLRVFFELVKENIVFIFTDLHVPWELLLLDRHQCS